MMNQNADHREIPQSEETVFNGVLIHVNHMQVELPNGEKALREIVLHPGASAVVALDDQGQILLVRQHRVAIDRLTLEIPAGKLDSPDEDPFLCAQRELEEETGMKAKHWRKLTVLATTPGFCNERIHMYMATGLEEGTVNLDEDEFLTVSRMPLEEAVANVMNGTFRDGKTCLGIMMAAQIVASEHKND